jgi:putative uncharacterized protein cgl0837
VRRRFGFGRAAAPCQRRSRAVPIAGTKNPDRAVAAALYSGNSTTISNQARRAALFHRVCEGVVAPRRIMSQRSFASRTARPALILGVSATILSLGLSACSVSMSGTRKPSNGSRTPAASATADTQTQQHIGECFQFGPDEDSEVTSVDCNQPHDGEYFHIFDFAGTNRPSDDEFNEESDEVCGLIFEHYVGKPVADSTLDYDWMLPISQTWEKGDHTVQCYLFAKDDSKLTGSARNSNM